MCSCKASGGGDKCSFIAFITLHKMFFFYIISFCPYKHKLLTLGKKNDQEWLIDLPDIAARKFQTQSMNMYFQSLCSRFGGGLLWSSKYGSLNLRHQ